MKDNLTTLKHIFSVNRMNILSITAISLLLLVAEKFSAIFNLIISDRERDLFSLGFSNFFRQFEQIEFTGRTVTTLTWVLIGAVVYLLGWILINVILELYNEYVYERFYINKPSFGQRFKVSLIHSATLVIFFGILIIVLGYSVPAVLNYLDLTFVEGSAIKFIYAWLILSVSTYGLLAGYRLLKKANEFAR